MSAGPHRAAVSRRALVGGAAATVVAAATAVLLTRDRRTPVERMLARDPFWVAHRGGSDERPEMSVAAYRHAVAAGVDAVEVSLARTSDGVWFGLHDATLDRTSGTRGFVAAERTWAEVRRERIAGTAGTGDAQPYARLEDIVDAVGDGPALFVDPKAVPPSRYGELLDLMGRLVDDPRGTYVAKSYFRGTAWARAARARGIRTWGYLYERDLAGAAGAPVVLPGPWSMLGMEVDASAEAWTTVRSYGRPVIAHVVRSRADVARARAERAQGLMVSRPSLVPS